MLRRVLLISSLIIAQGSATADTVVEDFNGTFGLTGYEMREGNPTAQHCQPVLELDRKKLMDNTALLKKMGVIDPDVSETKLSHEPMTVGFGYMMQVMAIAAKFVYDHHPEADRCRFDQYITFQDDYGNDKRIEAVTFNFTRAIYKKINWDKFISSKITTVAPQFRVTPDFMKLVSDEQ